MDCARCGHDPCTCRTSLWPHLATIVRSTEQPVPLGITREEFGTMLYDTVLTIGGLLGIEQQRAAAIHYGQGDKITGILTRRATLQQALARQLPTLSELETGEILLRYPWVVHA